MQAIVAADRNWGIGFQGKLLVSIPNDHKMFRKLTLNKVVVYGRKTLETFPMQQPLDRRTNIVLSANRDLQVKGATVVHSIEELLEAVKPYPPEDICVIGGATVYRELLPYTDHVYVTKLDYAYQADAYFPDLDHDPHWKMTGEGEEQTYFDVPYVFAEYSRNED